MTYGRGTINQKEQLQILKGDFILEHKDQKLSDVYLVNEDVLGEGAFGKV